MLVENLDSKISGKKDNLVVVLNVDKQNLIYKCYLKENVENQSVRDLINQGKLKIVDKIPKNIANVISLNNPQVTTNPLFKGFVWLNIKTLEKFECVKNNKDDNVWIGDKGTIIMNIPPADKVDFFGDKSGIALFKFNNSLTDESGKYKAVKNGDVTYVEGKEKLAVYSNGGQLRINKLPFNKDTKEVNVSFWFKWNGMNYQMPIGFYKCDLYICKSGKLGFNTGNGDNFGVDINKYKNKWIHVSANFRKFEYGDIFINGKKQTLKQNCSKISKYNMYFSNYLCVFGWGVTNSYRKAGAVDRLRIFTRNLTESEVDLIYKTEGGK